MESEYKSLKHFTNKELIEILDKNEVLELSFLSGICSEILRRMNEIIPLFKNENDYE